MLCSERSQTLSVATLWQPYPWVHAHEHVCACTLRARPILRRLLGMETGRQAARRLRQPSPINSTAKSTLSSEQQPCPPNYNPSSARVYPR
jgi:hypothetical protein